MQFFADWTTDHVDSLEAFKMLSSCPVVADLVPMNLITYNMFLQLFLIRTTYFSSLLFPLKFKVN